MSLLLAAIGGKAPGFPGVITVSGEVILHTVDNGFTAKAGLRLVTANGTIDKREGDVYTQIDASTDIVIPNQSTVGLHVRFEKSPVDPTPIGTLDTWLAWTSNLEVRYEETTNDTQTGGSISVFVSDDGGATTLDSDTYTVVATVGLP